MTVIQMDCLASALTLKLFENERFDYYNENDIERWMCHYTLIREIISHLNEDKNDIQDKEKAK